MKNFLSLIFIIHFLFHTAQASPWDADSIRTALDGRVLDPIEGVWQFPDDGATLLILRASATTFDIIMLDSPRLDVPPGINIGSAAVTPTLRTYDAKLDNKALGDNKLKKSTTSITVTDDGVLRFKPYSQGWSMSIKRWIPYFLRITFREDSKPDGLTGATRIYPPKFTPIL